jgi:argininosuccinate lyase
MKNNSYEEMKKRVELEDGDKFPAKSFTELVLKPAYDNAKDKLLDPMMEVNYAHLIMLYEQKLLDKEEAKKIAKTLEELELDRFRNGNYTGEYEDLFFEVEDALLKSAGDIAGNLHLARSRNDMGVTMYRMVMRKYLLETMKSLYKLIETFVCLSEEHKDTIMVAHTHTQQAQITTLGHYILAVCQILSRDMDRLKHAFKTVNRSSMGACAITTTGFSIDRQIMVELLGFDEMVVNSYDAIGGGDYLGETATAVMLAAIDAGKVVQDFLLWATQEFNVLRAGDPYVQVSSIMPQKRNPVSIEHLRSLLSTSIGNCQTLLTMLHNTPYGDIVDTEDDAQPYGWMACEILSKSYILFSNVMSTIEVNKEVLLQRAYNGFATITELADTLVRETGVPFRKAHSVASKLATEYVAKGMSIQDMDEDHVKSVFEQVTGLGWEMDYTKIKESIDPKHFVNVRNIKGGCGPAAMEDMLLEANQINVSHKEWISKKQELIVNAHNDLRNRINSLLEE